MPLPTMAPALALLVCLAQAGLGGAARSADWQPRNSSASALLVREKVETAHGHDASLVAQSFFKADLAALTSHVAYKVTTAVSTNVKALGSSSSVVNGITVVAGKHGHQLLRYVSWAGVAASGWLATDAIAELMKANSTCMKSVQGGRFLVSLGSMALSIASLTCLAGTDGGAVASFTSALSGALWSNLQSSMEKWCRSGVEDDRMEVKLPVTGEINSQERLNAALSRQMGMNLGACKAMKTAKPGTSRFVRPRKADVFLDPKEADLRYKPKKKGFTQMLREDWDRPTSCLRGFSYHISEYSSYEHLCTSSWS